MPHDRNTSEKNAPKEISEFRDLGLVCGIDLVDLMRLYENTNLVALASEHDYAAHEGARTHDILHRPRNSLLAVGHDEHIIETTDAERGRYQYRRVYDAKCTYILYKSGLLGWRSNTSLVA